MTSADVYLDQQRQAVERYRAGDLQEAKNIQTRLVQQLLELGVETIHSQSQLMTILEEASQQLIDVLRWEKDYERAIDLQERLLEFIPRASASIRLGIANLHIEAGRTEQGLQQFQELVRQDPNNIWIWLSLSAGYLWLKQESEAEEALQRAASLPRLRRADRAMAQKYLFDLYAGQGRMEQAVVAWNEACRLDNKMTKLLPQVCRWLIYWRKYEDANVMLARETVQPRRLFYQGLLAFRHGNFLEANKQWKMLLMDYRPDQVRGAEDEYGEACAYLVNPTLAVMAVDPLIQKGKMNYFRMVVAGLAWAQKRALERARWCLDIALRLGDLDRPRRTRPAPQGRIMDIHARRFYGDIVIDADIRKSLNGFFIPDKIGESS